ncbi:lipase family protein [Nocardia sp. NPDC051030]|uniref:lipase family protein n=1 Tax=Nocardia sp. NPDC051030 TaxID=3155162 RepID=UPI00343D274B
MTRRMVRSFVACLTVAAGFAGIPQVQADPGMPPLPAQDPFYAQPDSLRGMGMGQVVDSRPIALTGVSAQAPLSAWQVKYVSQDTKGKPWTTMATVIKPSVPNPQAKLVSFQPWIDALDTRCNPSYQLRAGVPYQASTGMIAENGNLATFLDHGYTVVVPDYLGPENQFAAGYVEGRATLDGIRAAENFAPAGLNGNATPVGLFGYSGGARGTEFAAELAADYAPELKIVGSAAGGLPTDMGRSAEVMNGGPFGGINFSASYGIARAYPELNIPAYFNDPGLLPALSGMCQTQILGSYPFVPMQSKTVNGVWPLGDPQVQAVLDTLKAGHYGTPNAPLYLFMAEHDEIAVTEGTDALVDEYHRRGVDVTYVKYPGTEHVIAESVGSPAAITWVVDHLNAAN